MAISAHERPVRVEEATLIVRDLGKMRAFYRDVLGLVEIRSEPARCRLGVADAAFLTLEEDPSAAPPPKGAQGLHHIAFLFPDRDELGAWLVHAAAHGVEPTGASDHGVSEALYLDDPEGNGVELYADRAEHDWPRGPSGQAVFGRDPFDLAALTADAPKWGGAPPDTRIGHVHLRVADADAAIERHRTQLKLDMVATAPSVGFLGSGGYHHHLAVNSWRSAGGPPAASANSGLAEIVFTASSGAFDDIARAAAVDPARGALAFEDDAARRIAVRRR